MPLWIQALLFGIFSALSLPVGALLGIWLAPVSEKTTARWMAFGSGALVFAVATQLYGAELYGLLYAATIGKEKGIGCSKVCRTRFSNVLLQNVCGILGSILYVALNRLLERLARPSPLPDGGADTGVADAEGGYIAMGPAGAAANGAASLSAAGAEASAPAGAAAAAAAGSLSVRSVTAPCAEAVAPAAPSRAARSRSAAVPSAGPRGSTSLLSAPSRALPPIAALASLRRASSRVAAPRLAPPAEVGSQRRLSATWSMGDDDPPPRLADGTVVEAAQFGEQPEGEDISLEGNVALSMWLGLLIDGIPEALMLGFMTNEKTISSEFIVAIFIANFPEAFSGASMLRKQGMSVQRVFLMWFIVFALTGFLAMIGSLILPNTVNKGSIEERVRDSSTAALEGLTGGAMLAMIATAMLPEALKGAGERAGILFVVGFVLSVFISALGGRYGSPQSFGG